MPDWGASDRDGLLSLSLKVTGCFPGLLGSITSSAGGPRVRRSHGIDRHNNKQRRRGTAFNWTIKETGIKRER